MPNWMSNWNFSACQTASTMIQDSRFKILYSHKPMHYNGTEINTNIQYQYLHAHDNVGGAALCCANTAISVKLLSKDNVN